jgi:ketosteroid isomerase-like protein
LLGEHPNATLVRSGFERFVQGDVAGLIGLFADDAVWHVPGTNAVAGDYRGREEIVAFLRRTAELTGGTYRVELLWVVADDEHTVAVYRAQGEREGRGLDIEQALLIQLRDGLWIDIRAQPLDQAAFDAFWAPSNA